MSIYLRGFIIGISIAAPVGPIGVLCIRRTLAEGRLSGLVSGLGAAAADGIYGIIAGFGLTFISSFLVSQQIWLGLLGGAFLCYLGIRTLLSQPVQKVIQTKKSGLGANYFSIFILTLTNPMTILSFAAIFAGLGLAQSESNYAAALLLVVGVFSGSAAWWLLLSFGVGLFRTRVTHQWMVWINRVSGGIILILGIISIFSGFRS
jgi:threonine/homoserine/homoserine lactone efflux protein